jgi:DNA repair protein RadC
MAPSVYSLACLKQFRDRQQEYFVTLSLDSAGRLIKRRAVTIGLLSVSLVYPREVFAGPLMDRAASLIICHKPSRLAKRNRARKIFKTTQ